MLQSNNKANDNVFLFFSLHSFEKKSKNKKKNKKK